MIELQIQNDGYELTDNILEYVHTKIGGLEKYLPKAKRDGVKGHVILSLDQSGREDNQCVCEVQIPVKGAVLEAKEATINMFAAVDIVEAKLKAQIFRYKAKHSPTQNRAKIFVAKILRRNAEL